MGHHSKLYNNNNHFLSTILYYYWAHCALQRLTNYNAEWKLYTDLNQDKIIANTTNMKTKPLTNQLPKLKTSEPTNSVDKHKHTHTHTHIHTKTIIFHVYVKHCAQTKAGWGDTLINSKPCCNALHFINESNAQLSKICPAIGHRHSHLYISVNVMLNVSGVMLHITSCTCGSE